MSDTGLKSVPEWNEFERDWAMAPFRSGQVRGDAFAGKTVCVRGGRETLRQAVEWSFLPWNLSGIQSSEAETCDYLILCGFCCQKLPADVSEEIQALKNWENDLEQALSRVKIQALLLSDGRVFGRLAPSFAVSEYETGSICPGKDSEALFLQTVENLFVQKARDHNIPFQILRFGEVYGPCLTQEADFGGQTAAVPDAGSYGSGAVVPDAGSSGSAEALARSTVRRQELTLPIDTKAGSYICIHDALTAIQFALSKCPKNKILHASGKDSDATPGELAMLLHRNFPGQCRISLQGTGENVPEAPLPFSRPALLNTQLMELYGFAPQVSLEDGMIMLVKSLQEKEGIFIFDHTYKGKLDTVHEILLGYLLEIDRICRKHNIRYFLAGGTLLGAIRHHGFIPWDDDADVMMLREDFDRFMKIAPDELPENIFVQTAETERLNHNAFTKLRINNTLFSTEFTGRFPDMHNGIFFDVLAHDRTGNHRWSQKLHLMGTMLSRSIVFNKWGDTNIKSGGAHPLICKVVDRAKYLVPMPLAEWAQNKMYRFFQHRNTEYLYDGMGRNLKRGPFPRAWLEETLLVEFEGHMLPVPKEYDKYLTWLYGDYMQMIPVSERRVSHSIVLMDLGEYSGYHCPQPEQNIADSSAGEACFGHCGQQPG